MSRRLMIDRVSFFVFLVLFFSLRSYARMAYVLPNTCHELMPDISAYIGFFEAVALGLTTTDRALARRLLRILELRNKLNEVTDRVKNDNPIDRLIEKTLCFYRQQKEPLKLVTFDDSDFIKYLRQSLKELELKVDDVVFQCELERLQRKQYEELLQKNQSMIQKIRDEARELAERSFHRLSQSAKRRVGAP